MNSKDINKTLDKAHKFTNAILQEMDETYPQDQIPYFLHVWVLQAAHGLIHYGFEPADVQDLIASELEPLRNITFDFITNLLPQPRSKSEEAWEFRFLHAEGNVDKVVYVEASDKEKMLRLTFPMFEKNGRGRIWLQRSDLTYITKEDLTDFVSIIQRLSQVADMGVLISPSAHKLITETIGAAELFDNGAVVVGRRGMK